MPIPYALVLFRNAALAVVASLTLASTSLAEVRYVRANLATGTDNGTSWANAYRGPLGLQSALAAAQSGDEIWVADGVYRTGATGQQSVSFLLRSGVAIYGGFSGTEDQLSQRDLAAHTSILSGDIAGNGNTSGLQADNSFHVVKAIDADSTAVLDGFTINGGVTDCCSQAQATGAGLQITRGAPTIRNCRFGQNDADTDGGDVAIIDASPLFEACSFDGTTVARRGLNVYHTGQSAATFRGCQFTGNPLTTGGSVGAGIYHNSAATPGLTVEDSYFSIHTRDFSCTAGVGIMAWLNTHTTIRRCDFIDNVTCGGGAVYNHGIASIDRCRFIGNEGSADGGAALFTNSAGSTTVTNCVFIGNSKTGFNTVMAQAPISFFNCTFTSNGRTNGFHTTIQATVAGTTLTNCILWSNKSSQGENSANVFLPSSGIRPTFNACLLQGWNGTLPGIGSFTADPKFVSLVGADGIAGTLDDDVHLRAGSPCQDRGTMTGLPATSTLDLDGTPRIFDEPRATFAGFGPIDLGAYERSRASRNAAYTPERDR